MIIKPKSFFCISLFLTFFVIAESCGNREEKKIPKNQTIVDNQEDKIAFTPPDTSRIPNDETGKLIWYGRELLLKTAYYIGPNGVKGKFLGNKMNCSSCHLEGGTKPYGLNYFSTYANYPQYRSRENRVLTLAERVNNCIERPHLGRPLPIKSTEMLAILAYIKWVGEEVPASEHGGSDVRIDIDFLDEPADTINGKIVYDNVCKSCHGENGEGKLRIDGISYEFPPLWGPKSYPPGSSMHRIIVAAQFIKANMPFGTTYENKKLTDKEAFDVAAFINSDQHRRPQKKGVDYPDNSTKPIDIPYGPYDDPFTATQHKYGPFKPIITYRKENGRKVVY